MIENRTDWNCEICGKHKNNKRGYYIHLRIRHKIQVHQKNGAVTKEEFIIKQIKEVIKNNARMSTKT